MVLLENNGVLPLDKDARVLVTGPYADEANVGDAGSSRVWDRQLVTPFAGLKKVFANVSLTEGDAAVVCVGSNRLKETSEYWPSLYTRTTLPRSVVMVSLDTLTFRLLTDTRKPTESVDRTLT